MTGSLRSPSTLMTSCLRHAIIIAFTFHYPCPTPIISSHFPPSVLPYPSCTPPTRETDTSTWFIMCLSVRLASTVWLRLPPGVIQSSPLPNPTAKSRRFRPPRTVSGLLSICRGTSLPEPLIRIPERRAMMTQMITEHKSSTPRSPSQLEHRTHERDQKITLVKIDWDCSLLNELLNDSVC